jgi:hypothetical protein
MIELRTVVKASPGDRATGDYRLLLGLLLIM